MKYLLFLALLTFNTVYASIDSYYCESVQARQHGLKIFSKVELRFDFVAEEGTEFLEDVVGSIKVSYEDNLNTDELYYGVFSFHERFQNLKYHPNKYKGYIQFPHFDVIDSNNFDGGGIWGDLVIENKPSADLLTAHYVFQAGDHMGGTIDLICEKH